MSVIREVADRVAHYFGYAKTQPLRNVPGWLQATGYAEKFSVPDGRLAATHAELYQRLSWVQIAVGHVARAAALTAFSVRERDGEKLRDIPNHAFERLLQAPNPLHSRFELLESLFSYRKLTGNGYWWLNRAGPAAPIYEMWPIPAHKIVPVPDENMFLKGYLYYPDGVTVPSSGYPLEVWEVLHVKTFHPLNTYVGLSPIEALATVAVGDMKMQEWSTNFFGKENAKVQGILAFADPISDPEWKKMKSQVEEQSGTKRKSMMMLRSVGKGGVEWVATAMSQKDMEFLASRQFNKEEIYDIFAPGLASMLAINSTEANSVTGKATFMELAVYPEQVAVAEKITNDILIPVHGEDTVGSFDDVRATDRELELKEQEAALKVMTVDEVREKYYELKPLADNRGTQLVQGPNTNGSKDILGYHIEAGVASKNEARADVGLPPVDDSEDERQRRVKSQLDLLTMAKGAGLPLEVAAELAGLELTPAQMSVITVERERAAQAQEQKLLPPPKEPQKKEESTKEVPVKALKGFYGVMVAFFVPRMEAELLWLIAQRGYWMSGEITPIADMHLTLCIAGSEDGGLPDRERLEIALREFARRASPLTGKVGGYGVFNPQDGRSPIYVSFDAPDLPAFRQSLVELMEDAGVETNQTHGFSPHITLAYSDNAEMDTPRRMPTLQMTFDSVVLAWGDERIEYELRGEGWEPEPPDAQLMEELAKWEKKAIKRVKAGKSAAVGFESDVIPADRAEILLHLLVDAKDEAAVKAVFGFRLTPAEQAIYDALLPLLTDHQGVITDVILAGGEVDWARLSEELRMAIVAYIEYEMLRAMGTFEASMGLGFLPERMTTEAGDWARAYSFDLVRRLTDTTRAIVQEAISRFLNTPGMTREQLEALLRPAFGAARAEAIAVSEVTRAASGAARLYQKMAEEMGVLLERVNHTNRDELVCAICGPLDGKPESEWPNGDGPPWHTRCRDFVTLRRKVMGDE